MATSLPLTKFSLIGAAFLTLGACMTNTAERAPTVVDPLLDKRLIGSKGGEFIIKSDGTMGGELRGEEVVGTYTANASESCSTYSAPAMLTGREFCSVPVIDGNTVVFKRRDGSTSQVYTIEG